MTMTDEQARRIAANMTPAEREQALARMGARLGEKAPAGDALEAVPYSLSHAMHAMSSDTPTDTACDDAPFPGMTTVALDEVGAYAEHHHSADDSCVAVRVPLNVLVVQHGWPMVLDNMYAANLAQHPLLTRVDPTPTDVWALVHLHSAYHGHAVGTLVGVVAIAPNSNTLWGPRWPMPR